MFCFCQHEPKSKEISFTQVSSDWPATDNNQQELNKLVITGWDAQLMTPPADELLIIPRDDISFSDSSVSTCVGPPRVRLHRFRLHRWVHQPETGFSPPPHLWSPVRDLAKLHDATTSFCPNSAQFKPLLARSTCIVHVSRAILKPSKSWLVLGKERLVVVKRRYAYNECSLRSRRRQREFSFCSWVTAMDNGYVFY